MEKIDIPRFGAKSGIMVSAKSFFNDRVEPEPELVSLPQYEIPKAEFSVEYSDKSILLKQKPKSFLRELKGKLASKDIFEEITDNTLIDFRGNSPENWAHTLDFYIPLAFFLNNYIEKNQIDKPACFILPKKSPKYIINLFKLFELNFHLSDANIVGSSISFKVGSFGSFRGLARTWVETLIHDSEMFKNLSQRTLRYPKKIFLSRKDTRRIENESEVESYLSNLGYKKIYAEELAVEDQICLFLQSDYIVAIHGAAMAPLLYIDKPLKIIEIFNPGHMSKFYRVMSSQVNAIWIGVRGRIERRHVEGAYNFNEKYLKTSLSNFYLDLDSLKLALELIEN